MARQPNFVPLLPYQMFSGLIPIFSHCAGRAITLYSLGTVLDETAYRVYLNSFYILSGDCSGQGKEI